MSLTRAADREAAAGKGSVHETGLNPAAAAGLSGEGLSLPKSELFSDPPVSDGRESGANNYSGDRATASKGPTVKTKSSSTVRLEVEVVPLPEGSSGSATVDFEVGGGRRRRKISGEKNSVSTRQVFIEPHGNRNQVKGRENIS